MNIYYLKKMKEQKMKANIFTETQLSKLLLIQILT